MTSHKLATLAAAAVLALGSALPAAAQDADAEAEALAMLEEAIPGTLLHNPIDSQWSPGGNDLKSKVVDATGLPTGQAIQTKVKKKQKNGWDTQIALPITEEIKAGDKVRVIYFVRTVTPPKDAEAADMALFLGRKVEPYDSVIFHEFKPGTEWEQKVVEGVANADFPADSVKMEYHLGRAKQTVEIGPVYVSRID